jgi:thiol-disulfide isomerase/thioredoxin
MRRIGWIGGAIVVLVAWRGVEAGQAPTTIVKDVRTAIGCTSWPCSPSRDLSGGEALLEQYRSAHDTTPEGLEALSWLGRAALAGEQLDQATRYASETYALGTALLRERSLEKERPLEIALGAAIEVLAQARAARGQRSDAVYYLRRELDKFGDSPLHRRIQKNLHLLSLEGQAAPPLVEGDTLGPSLPGPDELSGKVVVMFFWAHWCPDCKAQAPILSKLLERHRSDGVVLIAPTQRYGYTVRRKPADADAELRYISQVRDEAYPALREAPVPVSELNHTRYGVSTTPTLVVVDREGIVRLYHPGTMTEAALQAAVEPLLTEKPATP